MVIREISREVYAAFVASHPESRVFHQVSWLEAVRRSYDVNLFYLGIYAGDHLVGALPVFILRKFFLRLYGSPLRRIGMPPAVPILVPPGKNAEVLRALDQWVHDKRIKHFQLTWPGSAELNGTPKRVRIEAIDNLEVDLSEDLETIWKNLSELPRRMVRRALRQGVRIHWANRAEFVAGYSRLLASTYDRQGLRPNFPLSMYHELCAGMSKKSLRAMYAVYKGKVIAAAWLPCSEERCHYWDAASLQEYRELSAGHLLVWEIIRWAKKRGFKVFDMVGTSIGGRGGMRPGIGRFKQSFGAKPVPYRIIYWQAWWLRLALRLYRAVMNIKNRLALRLAVVLRRKGEK